LGRTFSTLMFSDYVREKREKIKWKHDILVVWDKDSYTGSFLVLFPWMYVCILTPIGLSPLIFFKFH
jgi:hypothetical protein